MAYLTHELPWPVDNGHKIRVAQLLGALSAHVDVYVCGFTEYPVEEVAARIAAAIPGVRGVLAHRRSIRVRRDPLKLAVALATALARRAPYSVTKFQDRQFEAQFRGLIAQGALDAVIASLQMSTYTRPSDGIPMVLDSHNVEHLLWDGFLTSTRGAARSFVAREVRLLKQTEIAAWRNAAAIISICEEDAAIIRRLSGVEATVAPVEIAPSEIGSTPISPQADVGLLGVWSWAPNEDAIHWFANEIAPRLRARGYSCRVAGRGLAEGAAAALAASGVEVVGYVADLADFYAGVRVIVAPYRRGGGVRMKVAEAMAHEVPVVGTPLAFRGIGGGGRSTGIVAETPEEIVAGVARLCAEPAMAARSAAEARAELAAHHSPKLVRHRLGELLARLELTE